MELGKKLLQARQEAGLSQRQLCEGIVTRNMLSQIENGSARPSMKTLQLLSQRLGKNVSFFLEEMAVLSPNRQQMTIAREGYDRKDYAGALAALEDYQTPDPVYDREYGLLRSLCCLGYARQQAALGKNQYARELLAQVQTDGIYCGELLEQQRLLLLGQLGEPVADKLPSLDPELMVRAREAGSEKRAEKLLEAVEDQTQEQWQYLRGKLCLERKQYKKALRHLQAAEIRYPKETAPLLELCCRELGDYKQAYYYACKQK